MAVERSDMTNKIFKEFKDEIRNYCDKNNLSFDRLRKSPCCYDDEELIIQRSERDHEREKLGLMDNVPTPATLEIYLENGRLRFMQTKYTHLLLADEPIAVTVGRKPALMTAMA